MKWLDECPTSNQPGSHAVSPEGRRFFRLGVCVDRPGACTLGTVDTGSPCYWSTANTYIHTQVEPQEQRASSLHLIDFRKWRKIVSKRQDQVNSGQSENWNCTLVLQYMVCVCECAGVWVWVCGCVGVGVCVLVICIALLCEKHLPLFYSIHFLAMNWTWGFLNSISVGIWNLKA